MRPKDANATIDPSHQPTRKIESMSTLVAEMIVEAHDAEDTGAQADSAALEMARLIEVRTNPPPPPEPEPADDLELPLGRPRKSVAIVIGIVASLAAAFIAVALLSGR